LEFCRSNRSLNFSGKATSALGGKKNNADGIFDGVFKEWDENGKIFIKQKACWVV